MTLTRARFDTYPSGILGVKDSRLVGVSVLFALVHSLVYPTLGNFTYSAVVALLTVVVLLVANDTTDGDAWNAFPKRDYLGRYAELGGLTRAEQEEAIEEVREKTNDSVPDDR